MILLDTTILVYAVGADHPLRSPCRAVVAAIGEGRLAATSTVEVVQELAHIRARRRGREDAARLAEQFAQLLAPLVTLDGDDLVAGLQLFREHDRLGAFDAVLAGAARRRSHVTAIASADRAFAMVSGLAHHDPSDPDFATTLGI